MERMESTAKMGKMVRLERLDLLVSSIKKFSDGFLLIFGIIQDLRVQTALMEVQEVPELPVRTVKMEHQEVLEPLELLAQPGQLALLDQVNNIHSKFQIDF
jgi:hypothetical protein